MILNKYSSVIMNETLLSTRIAIDTETISLTDKTIVGFSFAYIKGNKIKSYYIPIRHSKFDNMPLGDVQVILVLLLNHPQLVFHNYVFDAMVFKQFGISVASPIVHDTMIIAHLLDENDRQGLKPCALRYCNHQMTTFKEVCGTGKSQISFADVEEDIADSYASEDAEYTLKLFNVLYPLLIADKDLYKIYETIERPLLFVVEDMQIGGITIDVAQVNRIREECQKQVSNALERIEYLMPKIKINSTKELRGWFLDKKRLQPLKVSRKTGNGSVDKEFLEYYETDKRCPEIKTILAYRKYSKILSTFIPALTPMAGTKIYAQFRQSGTTSGRFSSSNPNMQNIPRTGDEFDIRASIIADKGEVLIGADYSQIELRIAAHFSQEPSMLKIYKEGGDIHQQTADACGSTRQEAKIINFGLLYGMYFKTLAKQLEIDEQKAITYHDGFWEKYPALEKFIEKSKVDAIKNKYTITFFGRKRHLSVEFHDKDDFKKGAELRSLVNAIVQGTGADLMKLAMLSMYPQLKKIGARIVLTCHDEVIVSCPKSKKQRAYAIVHRSMVEAGVDLSIPITVDAKIGKTWSEVHG